MGKHTHTQSAVREWPWERWVAPSCLSLAWPGPGTSQSTGSGGETRLRNCDVQHPAQPPSTVYGRAALSEAQVDTPPWTLHHWTGDGPNQRFSLLTAFPHTCPSSMQEVSSPLIDRLATRFPFPLPKSTVFVGLGTTLYPHSAAISAFVLSASTLICRSRVIAERHLRANLSCLPNQQAGGRPESSLDHGQR